MKETFCICPDDSVLFVMISSSLSMVFSENTLNSSSSTIISSSEISSLLAYFKFALRVSSKINGEAPMYPILSVFFVALPSNGKSAPDNIPKRVLFHFHLLQ